MAQIKQDPDAMYIKQDPDDKDMVLADLDDEDLYEDAGDLDFSAANQHVWMSRLPRQLWENWAHIDDEDEEIEIGTIRIEGDPSDLKRVCSAAASHVHRPWILTQFRTLGQLTTSRPKRQPRNPQGLHPTATNSHFNKRLTYDPKYLRFHREGCPWGGKSNGRVWRDPLSFVRGYEA